MKYTLAAARFILPGLVALLLVLLLVELEGCTVGPKYVMPSVPTSANYKEEAPISSLRILESEAHQQQRALTSSKESLQLFTNRYKGGVDTYLQVITAQTTELANERNAFDIERRRMDASVLLIKALGGGRNASKLPQDANLR